MCLISKWRFPRKAKEDIVCYKILRRSTFHGGWITPVRFTPVSLNEMLIANKEHSTFSLDNPKSKGGGYIHAYTQENYALASAHRQCYCKIFKAIIPKGTKYHVSKYKTEICAMRMFITDEGK